MKTTALGLIEVIGYIGAVEAADAALKTANVTLMGAEKARGGLVTIKLTGDVAAVREAVDAGSESAKKVSQLISAHVIARAHDETMTLVETAGNDDFDYDDKPSKEHKVEHPEEPPIEETKDPIEETLDEKSHLEVSPTEIEKEFTEKEESHEQNLEKEEGKETKVQMDDNVQIPTFSEQELEKMTVEELRKLARSLHLKKVNSKDIKYGRKKFLIKIITEYYREVNR